MRRFDGNWLCVAPMGGMALVRTYRVLDRDYPQALRELARPPDPMVVRGDLPPGPAVAIVGTRAPSPEAERYAHDLAFRLAVRGVTVWSGGAIGIDAAAHRGALDAGGLTVAVVGTGLDHCYPDQHALLYEEIVGKGGALVSPFPATQHAQFWTFHHRNGVLAALSQATVVVQSPLRSGARSTARHARRLGRPLYVLPASLWDERSAGNLAELALGARLLANEATLFKFFDRSRPSEDSPPGEEGASLVPIPASIDLISSLSAACQAVHRATRNTPRHPDDLASETGLPPALLQEALLTLTLEAVLVEGPAGWFRRANGRND